MIKRILAIAGITVLIIGATVLAVGHTTRNSQGPGHGEGHGPGRGPGMGPDMVGHMTKALNLTSDQQAQVKALVEGLHAAEEPRHARIHELRKSMEAATANGQFDEAKVRAIANEEALLVAESRVDHERMKSKIYGLLTAEQRVKAEELHKRGGPHERRPGPPPPPPGE